MTEQEFMKNYSAFPDGKYKLGMTLRDYFAAKALTAIYQDYVDETRSDAEKVSLGAPYEPGVSALCMARECYAIADAMIYVRNLQEGEI